MDTKDLVALPRKERADRTYQRIVYRKLVDFQTSIVQAKRVDVPLGVCGELDTKALIADICEIGDIEYRSPDENVENIPDVLEDIKV